MTGGFAPGTIPNAVVGMGLDGGMFPTKAWREHLRPMQAEAAAPMGITQAACAQMESAKLPRKATLQKLADAMGLTQKQLSW